MEWIKTNDRLPENEQDVIFYDIYESKCFCGYYSEDRFYENLDDYDFEHERILYWMLLPEPPKDE